MQETIAERAPTPGSGQLAVGPAAIADRIGFAKLTKMAFDGISLVPLRDDLMDQVADGTAGAGVGLDLSLIAQLLGDKRAGLLMQAEILAFHRIFRTPCAAAQPRLRGLALAAAIDMGGNTPIEFLLEGSDVELTTLYVVPGAGFPEPLPPHDVAIVVASDSAECRDALRDIDRVAAQWPRPLLNPPRLIGNLDRDKLHRLLRGVDGIDIPATVGVSRARLAAAAHPTEILPDVAPGGGGPVIIRPRGSHAGVGLAKIDDGAALHRYLAQRPEQDFFVSRFVDYSGADGLFRKYRLAVVDGRPYACHMAIADRWDIWYLNAGMAFSDAKRREEAAFMRNFDTEFAARHRHALQGMSARIGLDYFTVDCAENRDGELLVFEADNTAVVHNMDSPELFPYKPPQMRLIFDAFVRMLGDRAERQRTTAA
ncbi:MAG: ATP-grasp domain-containing protein [Xanthobacteraceae bacterium]